MAIIEIIPAIDILGGRCVRLLKGDYQQQTVYGSDPLVIARRWAEEGAPRLHIVDLGGALEGYPEQLELIGDLCRAVEIPTQVGGGIRTLEHAQSVLEAGADRVIIGTTAIENPELAAAMFETLGEQAVLGLDARDGQAATQGWQATTAHNYLSVAQAAEQWGAKRIIFTNIDLDGTLSGTQVEPIRALIQAVSIPVIASGGVSRLEDLQALNALSKEGLEGVIVGKALYERCFTIRDALKTLRA